ncbi:MAG: dihydrodipicolinate reductase [Cyanobacteria bacterium RYN_339]|nr:dihydrodipicolinate reductase [Cyanobacteria bacterium RYN_339]
MIRVVLAGAAGKMGREVIKALDGAEGIQLVGAVSPRHAGRDVGELAGLPRRGLAVEATLANCARGEVFVDFTNPDVVMANALEALKLGYRPLIGSTGMSKADLELLQRESLAHGLGTLVAPNFAIGALLMIRFAAEAAKYFEHAEIMEQHHHQKLDAPSGTALKTAEAMLASRATFERAHPDEVEKLAGARGADLDGIRIHSVRLPGMLAHQEVYFGGLGQVLTIRHDALSRECYMPGVLLGIRKLMDITGLVVGLEQVL